MLTEQIFLGILLGLFSSAKGALSVLVFFVLWCYGVYRTSITLKKDESKDKMILILPGKRLSRFILFQTIENLFILQPFQKNKILYIT